MFALIFIQTKLSEDEKAVNKQIETEKKLKAQQEEEGIPQ